MSKFSCLFVFVAMTMCCVAQCADIPSVFGREKWLRLSTDQKDGFVSGFVDCKYLGPESATYPKGTRIEWAKWISNVYDLGKANSQEISAVLIEFDRTIGMQKKGSAFEQHSYFDGEFWRQVSNDERELFIEGMLLCKKLRGAQGYAKEPKYYVSLVSQWYGIDAEDVAEINEKRAAEKIATVMTKIGERETSGPVK